MSKKVLYCEKHIELVEGDKCPIDNRCVEFIALDDKQLKAFKNKLPKARLKNIEKEKKEPKTDTTVDPNDLWW